MMKGKIDIFDSFYLVPERAVDLLVRLPAFGDGFVIQESIRQLVVHLQDIVHHLHGYGNGKAAA